MDSFIPMLIKVMKKYLVLPGASAGPIYRDTLLKHFPKMSTARKQPFQPRQLNISTSFLRLRKNWRFYPLLGGKNSLLQEKPVLDAFWSWIKEISPKVLASSRLGKALQYANNQKEGLMNYLLDGNCSISNNLSENSIRPFTIGRKNWLYSGSPKGAEASAGIYTLIETAKANGLNPWKYINSFSSIFPELHFLNIQNIWKNKCHGIR